jgi:hypothetical protein
VVAFTVQMWEIFACFSRHRLILLVQDLRISCLAPFVFLPLSFNLKNNLE